MKTKAECLSDNGFSCKNIEHNQHAQLEKAMEEYHSQFTREISDEELNHVRNLYMAEWKKYNSTFPSESESTYWSGVNDGIYFLRNYLKTIKNEK
ncbi:MAG: hypothetical protein AABY22_27780 [Nanoarchaeota archaeon]